MDTLRATPHTATQLAWMLTCPLSAILASTLSLPPPPPPPLHERYVAYWARLLARKGYRVEKGKTLAYNNVVGVVDIQASKPHETIIVEVKTGRITRLHHAQLAVYTALAEKTNPNKKITAILAHRTRKTPLPGNWQQLLARARTLIENPGSQPPQPPLARPGPHCRLCSSATICPYSL